MISSVSVLLKTKSFSAAGKKRLVPGKMLGKFLFFTVAFLGILNQSCATPLTKEISLSSIQPKNTDLAELILKQLIAEPKQTLASLAQLFATNENPQVSDILDIINLNFQSRMFVLNGDYIELNPLALNQFLSSKSSDLVKVLFPQDPIRQLMAQGVLQVPLQKAVEDALPEIEAKRIPVERITSLYPVQDRSLLTRDSIIDEIYSAIISSIQNALCETVVDFLVDEIENIIDSISSILSSLEDTNITFIDDLVDEAQSILSNVSSYVSSTLSELATDYCTNITISRKRRDLMEVEGREIELYDLEKSVHVVKRDTALINILLALSDVIGSFLVSTLNSILKALAGWLISYIESIIDSFLEDTVLSAIESVIDVILSTS
ncbi:uncharacterized protein LOC115885938 [Sitophilus oryzae]|uniref:Uncharacterized protein LOC115885938 n=1 Tax=Sitophilus oryzae TaxID=7048 RepID=A0A6J2YD67_SITOR|nr:uncharacterized protein LOC115885938 [Sitophilus oryzae]